MIVTATTDIQWMYPICCTLSMKTVILFCMLFLRSMYIFAPPLSSCKFCLFLLSQPSVNPAISAFDHPTLFDAVCSPTFGQILQPTASNQSDLLINPADQSDPFIVSTTPRSQSSVCLQPTPAAGRQSASPMQSNSGGQSSDLSQSKSPRQFVDYDLIEKEDMSDLFVDDDQEVT